VLHIQLAHYFAVDTFVACFAAAALFFGQRAWQRESLVDALIAGVMAGLATASKVSALMLLPVLGLAFIWPRRGRPSMSQFFDGMTAVGVALVGAFFAFRVAEPYAFLGPAVWSLRPNPQWFADKNYWTQVSSGAIDVPLDLLYSTEAVVVGLMTILLPYMVISIANTLSGLDPRYEEAAQSLGAGPIRTFVHVTLPLSTPGVASGMLLVFLLTLSAYVTITLLGGPRSKLLVSMIYDNVVSFQWPRAAALAFILLAIALALTGIIMAALRPARVQGTGR